MHFMAMFAFEGFAETVNSQFQHGLMSIYCVVAVCRNSGFAISARIYTDVLLCKRFMEIASSQYQQGFITIIEL